MGSRNTLLASLLPLDGRCGASACSTSSVAIMVVELVKEVDAFASAGATQAPDVILMQISVLMHLTPLVQKDACLLVCLLYALGALEDCVDIDLLPSSPLDGPYTSTYFKTAASALIERWGISRQKLPLTSGMWSSYMGPAWPGG